MKLVVGLGNPGTRYRQTKHNVGFWVIDEIAGSVKTSISKKKFNSLYCDIKLRDCRCILAKPLTYMNLSGKAVKSFADYYKVNLEDILIILDDVTLQLGTIRMRPSGSAGGHNGLQSIIEHLGSSDFARLRIGINTEERIEDLSDYVLSKFNKEKDKLKRDEMVKLSCEAVLCWLEQGTVFVMNKFNKKKEVNF